MDTQEDELNAEVPNFSEPTQPEPMPVRRGLPPPPMRPPQTVMVPSIQEVEQQRRDRKEQAFLKSAYEHASSVAEAVKDVAAARRMLGIMRMDEARRGGMDSREAAYKNFSYFSQPGDKSFAPDMRAIAPAPRPSMENLTIPGTTNQVPVLVHGNQARAVPRSALPQPEFKGGVEEIAPGVKAARVGPNRLQLLERPPLAGQLAAETKIRIKDKDLEITELLREKHTLEREAIKSDGSVAEAFKAKPALEKQWSGYADKIAKLRQEKMNLVTKEVPGIGVRKMGAPAQAPSGKPVAGEVRRGYKYLGGDPAKPESWQKQ